VKRVLSAVLFLTVAALVVVSAQRPAFEPITDRTLLNPAAEDWIMYSRTYDAQRFSPLKQITRQNVGQLKEVFKIEFPSGQQESIPLVYRGVMYVFVPPNAVRAVDAATGQQIWEHKRPSGASRVKTLALYDDMVYWTAPDGFVVALDAQTGAVRWETKSSGGMTSGVIVVEGKVISGRACGGAGENCYVAAHDAKTGKELWRFRTAATDSDPGGASWAGSPEAGRMASPWGLPGAYDPQRRLIIWGIANPMPNTRADRHGGKADAIPTYAPADLYSNSTIALNPDTGKLAWYFQHLPGDDWDLDYTNERTLLRTAIEPDPKFVKWINPDVRRGEQREVSVMVGEGGGVFVNDRANGQFLWATPFPFDTPNFLIKSIDVKTGRVHANDDAMFKAPGERHVVCHWNTRSYWPTAYHPGQNALYVPYVDNCLDMTAANPATKARERRVGIPRPGASIETWAGLAKINMRTGEIQHLHKQRAPGNGAVLATAGDVVFWGDLDHVFRAFDAAGGKVLWEQRLNGPITNSTITYAVNGKQYVAVLTGQGAITGALMDQAGIKPNRGYNSLSVFALP
jgi:PQQ-dependent dehydrogenase (methanol/ethanol family)